MTEAEIIHLLIAGAAVAAVCESGRWAPPVRRWLNKKEPRLIQRVLDLEEAAKAKLEAGVQLVEHEAEIIRDHNPDHTKAAEGAIVSIRDDVQQAADAIRQRFQTSDTQVQSLQEQLTAAQAALAKEQQDHADDVAALKQAAGLG